MNEVIKIKIKVIWDLLDRKENNGIFWERNERKVGVSFFLLLEKKRRVPFSVIGQMKSNLTSIEE